MRSRRSQRHAIAPVPSRDNWGRGQSEGEKSGGKVSCQTPWRREHRHNYRCVKRVDNKRRSGRLVRANALYRLRREIHATVYSTAAL